MVKRSPTLVETFEGWDDDVDLDSDENEEEFSQLLARPTTPWPLDRRVIEAAAAARIFEEDQG